jgi:hypothetical protein
MYWYGYAPNNSPFVFRQYIGGNFDNGNPNPFQMVWTRPTASQSVSAIFEVDALVRFIPSAFMYVKLGVKVYASVFDSNPVYDLEINERPFSPSTNIVTWSTRSVIAVPLTYIGNFIQNMTFCVQMRRTDASSGPMIVYGVGGDYGMQHQLIVKRIQ